MVYGTIADIFYQWDYLGVFDFVLPFLLVFAIVFGILTASNIFGKNKAVAIIIAFVVGLMSLRYQYFFSSYISELFPRLGIGLGILLTVMILVGLFIAEKEQKYWGYGLASLAIIIAATIIYQSFDRLGWGLGSYGSETIGFIAIGVLIIAVIIAVAVSGSKGGDGSATWGLKRNEQQ